jgi:hypothetical protein
MHIEAESDRAARSGQLAPQRRERIVHVYDGGLCTAQCAEHLAFGPRDALEAAKALEVFVSGIGHKSHGRLGKRRECRDVACPVGAHLDDGRPVRRFQPHERERHADVIVEVAARGEALAHLRKDRGHHLLHRRLAVATADADERQGKLFAPRARERSQPRQRIRYDELRQYDGLQALHDGAGGSALRGLGHEQIGIEVRAAQRDEQLPGFERARIGGDFAEQAVLPLQLRADRACRFGKRALHARPCASSTTARSLNSRTSEP